MKTLVKKERKNENERRIKRGKREKNENTKERVRMKEWSIKRERGGKEVIKGERERERE